MIDRREVTRDKVMFGGVAAINDRGSTMDCIVRDISEHGARVEFGNTTKFPEQMKLTIARRGRSFLAKIVWWRANTLGVAFQTESAPNAPVAIDLEERLRRSEKKKRELQRRVKELLGEG